MSKLTDVDFYMSRLDNILKEHGVHDMKKSIVVFDFFKK